MEFLSFFAFSAQLNSIEYIHKHTFGIVTTNAFAIESGDQNLKYFTKLHTFVHTCNSFSIGSDSVVVSFSNLLNNLEANICKNDILVYEVELKWHHKAAENNWILFIQNSDSIASNVMLLNRINALAQMYVCI